MFCLGICLPREFRTKLVNWQFVDNVPALEEQKEVAIDRASDDEEEASTKRDKTGKGPAILYRTLGAIGRIADKFASKEDQPDAESQDSSDEDEVQAPCPARSPAPTVGRQILPAPSLCPISQTHQNLDATTTGTAARPLLREANLAFAPLTSTKKRPLSDERLLRKARKLLGYVGHEPYRDRCLEATEGLLAMASEGRSLPTRDQVYPLFRITPRPENRQSHMYEEWPYMKAFVNLLAKGGFSKRELWRIYLNMLEDWNMDDDAAKEAFEHLCNSSNAPPNLDKPMYWA